MRRFDVGIAALAAVHLGMISPVYILANNLADFARVDLIFTLTIGGAVAAIAFALMCLVLWISAALGALASLVARCALYFGTSLIFLTGLALPLTQEAQQVELGDVGINMFNLLLAVICAAAIGAVLFSRLRGAVVVGLTVVAVSTFATSAMSAFQGLRGSSSHALYSASSQKNVFVLGMDGVSGPIAYDIIRRRPDLQDAFRDFTLFANVISAAPATSASLATIVNGDTNLKDVFWGVAGGLDKLQYDKLLPNYLEDHGFQVANYMYQSFQLNQKATSQRGTMSAPPSTHEKVDQTLTLYRYAAARIFTPKLAFGLEWKARILAFLDRFGVSPAQSADLQQRLLRHHGASWDATLVSSLLDFEAYVQNLKVDLEVPVAHFTHFLHPHFPVDFDSQCRYRSDDAQWHAANQNRAGIVAETECTLSQFAAFLTKVRKLGIYDQSLIVLLSDHGFPAHADGASYGDPDNLESFVIRRQPNWGYARYTPMLAIKGFDERKKAITFDARPAILADLAKTICTATLASGCDHYKGYDLLSADGFPDDATYFVSIVEGPHSSFTTDKHETIKFKRTANFLEKLNEHLTAEILTELVVCGTIEIASAEDFNNGKSDYTSWVTWHSDGVGHVRFRRPKACPIGRVHLSFDSAPRWVKINGDAVPFEGSEIDLDLEGCRGELITVDFEGSRLQTLRSM
ncbi:sulfatase-like hydrolase/transferase [Rhizobium ruizarguesonis]